MLLDVLITLASFVFVWSFLLRAGRVGAAGAAGGEAAAGGTDSNLVASAALP